jgi:hypothetical protein
MAAVGGAERGGGLNAALAKAFAVRWASTPALGSWECHLWAPILRARTVPLPCPKQPGRGFLAPHRARRSWRGGVRLPRCVLWGHFLHRPSRSVVWLSGLSGRNTHPGSGKRKRHPTATHAKRTRTFAHTNSRTQHTSSQAVDIDFAVQRVADAAIAHPAELLSSASLRQLVGALKSHVSTALRAGALRAWLGRPPRLLEGAGAAPRSVMPLALEPTPVPRPRHPPDLQASARTALGLVQLAAIGSVPRRRQLVGQDGLLAAVVGLAGSGNASTAEGAMCSLSHLTCAGRVAVLFDGFLERAQ